MAEVKRYATVRINFLNGGTGECIRNVTREEFERIYKRLGFGDVPTYGVGACGDALVNFQWTIYRETPDYKPSLLMRLLPYQIRKAEVNKNA